MQFISNIKFLVLALVLILIAAACNPEAASTPTDAATATADGSGGDSGVGGSDGSTTDGGKDVAVDQDVNPEVGTDTGGGTDSEQPDVAKLCPPSNRPKATIEWMFEDGLGCVEPGDELQMFKDIKFAKFDPGGHNNPNSNMMPAAPVNLDGTGGCATIHMPDYCFPVVRAYSAKYIPKWVELLGENAGKNFLVVKYPDSSSYPNGGKELVIVGCETGVCTLISTYSDGLSNKATYEIAKKFLSISVYNKEKFGYTDEYKLE